MSDPHRFLRYVIPGLTFGVLTIVLVGIVLPEWTGKYLSSLKKDDVLPVLIAAVIGSGGVGFLFGEIHHWWLWSCIPPSMNHKTFVDRLINNGLIKFVNPTQKERADLREDNVDKRRAWIILHTLWHEQLKEGTNIKAVDTQAARMNNFVHSVGTGCVATFLSMIIALCLCGTHGEWSFERPDILRTIVAAIIAIVLFTVQVFGFCRICALAHQFMEQAFLNTFVDGNECRIVSFSSTSPKEK